MAFKFHAKIVIADWGRGWIEGFASTRNLDQLPRPIEPAAIHDSIQEYMKGSHLLYNFVPAYRYGEITYMRIEELGIFMAATMERSGQYWKLIGERKAAFEISVDIVNGRRVEEPFIIGLHIAKVEIVPIDAPFLYSIAAAIERGIDV